MLRPPACTYTKGAIPSEGHAYVELLGCGIAASQEREELADIPVALHLRLLNAGQEIVIGFVGARQGLSVDASEACQRRGEAKGCY